MLRRFLRDRASVATAARVMSWYPPYLGAGVSARAPDPYTLDVTMRLRWYNRNVVGTHFGGSLYAMCDPWYMLLLMRHLGPGHVVWDKAATVRFRRPGRGTVRARFHVPPQRIEEIRALADAQPTVEPGFSCDVLAEDGTVIATVDKLLYVRRRAEAP